jgi:hypothetical protein
MRWIIQRKSLSEYQGSSLVQYTLPFPRLFSTIYINYCPRFIYNNLHQLLSKIYLGCRMSNALRFQSGPFRSIPLRFTSPSALSSASRADRSLIGARDPTGATTNGLPIDWPLSQFWSPFLTIHKIAINMKRMLRKTSTVKELHPPVRCWSWRLWV